VPWKALTFRSYLEDELDSIGIEKARRYETGVLDGDEVSNSERLSDYPDYHTHAEDDLGPEYANRYKDPRPKKKKVAQPRVVHHRLVVRNIAPKVLPPGACPGSRMPVNGDTRLSQSFAVCSDCGQKVYIYTRRLPIGDYKNLHFMPIVSESTRLSVPSKTN
jgi:hypothetical protein